MLPYRDSRVTKIVLVVFFILIAAYACYEAWGLLRGPTIEIDNRVMEVHDSFITVEGAARRVTSLSMNGEPIPVTEEGAFSEGYVLVPGYNRIVLEAKDRYGKSTKHSIEIVYTPNYSSTTER